MRMAFGGTISLLGERVGVLTAADREGHLIARTELIEVPERPAVRDAVPRDDDVAGLAGKRGARPVADSHLVERRQGDPFEERGVEPEPWDRDRADAHLGLSRVRVRRRRDPGVVGGGGRGRGGRGGRGGWRCGRRRDRGGQGRGRRGAGSGWWRVSRRRGDLGIVGRALASARREHDCSGASKEEGPPIHCLPVSRARGAREKSGHDRARRRLTLPDARGDPESAIAGTGERDVRGASSEVALGCVDAGEVARSVLRERAGPSTHSHLSRLAPHCHEPSQVGENCLDERFVVEVEGPFVAVTARGRTDDRLTWALPVRPLRGAPRRGRHRALLGLGHQQAGAVEGAPIDASSNASVTNATEAWSMSRSVEATPGAMSASSDAEAQA